MANMSDKLVCTTLGMFIIDTFDVREASFDTKGVPDEAIGGGGVYVALGADMWLPADQVRMIIDRGSDWPSWVQEQLNTFRNIFHYRDNQTRLTTKAINTYHGETRDFAYLTPKRRLEPSDLYPDLQADYLHCVCAPDRLASILDELASLNWDPKIIYEPIPDLCLPSELENLRKVIGKVHVFSPNHEEGQAFFGAGDGSEASIEKLCSDFVGMGAKRVIVRSGSLGSCGLEKGGKVFWVRPYTTDQKKVVDPTGAGNAFLGGLIAGLSLHQDNLLEGMLYGSVSASLVLEQYGICSYDKTTGRWNGTAKQPKERLEELRQRIE